MGLTDGVKAMSKNVLKLNQREDKRDIASYRDPFRSFREEVNQLFDRFFGESMSLFDRPFLRGFAEPGTFSLSPSVDVHENSREYTMTVELPGIVEEDIEFFADNGRLVLRGSKNEEKDDKDGDAVLIKRRYGAFERVFPLPSSVDESKIEATFKRGVLKITLPKLPEAEGTAHRKIPIK